VHFYNFSAYCSMVADDERRRAFPRALERVVRPDTIVLDLGAGAGFFSILCAKLGARRVYAVEPNALIHLARQLARENGVEERIEFLPAPSTEIELEPKADLLLFDLRGSLPLFEGSLATIIDARDRLLAPGGVLVPRSDRILFAPASCETGWEKQIGRFARERLGVSVEGGRHLLTDTHLKLGAERMELLAAPAELAAIDYRTVRETSFERELTWEVERAATCHGLRAWFECELDDVERLANDLEHPDTVYGAPFFPFSRPVEVEAGDSIRSRVAALPRHGSYVWSWATEVRSAAGELRASFAQSTLTGSFVAPALELMRAEGYVGRRSEAAEIDLFVLERLDGSTSNGEIAEELRARFPESFATDDEALERVGVLVQAYGRRPPTPHDRARPTASRAD
jgi:SAM-dependent methyltransferase